MHERGREALASLQIILLALGAAIAYGIIHDQVTARVCVEFFTLWHPPLLGPSPPSPTLLGLAWGVLATWWVGLGLGVLLALAARAGPWPPRDARSLLRPVALLLLACGALAALAGTTAYLLAEAGRIRLLGPLAAKLPPARHAAFLADLWAHLASCGAGFLGGTLIALLTLRARARAAGEEAGSLALLRAGLRPHLPLRRPAGAATHAILALLWLGRFLGLAFFAISAAFLLGEGGLDLLRQGARPSLLLLLLAAAAAGYLVGWFREALGGALTVGALGLCYITGLASTGRLPPASAFALLSVPGFLFLAAWGGARWQGRGAASVSGEKRTLE